MKLLFKRSQSSRLDGRAVFRLWGKVELDDDEKEIVQLYRFNNAVLIDVEQPFLWRKAAFVAVLIAGIAFFAISYVYDMFTAGALAAGIGCIVGYGYYHQKRETILVKDLMHGRYFACDSVIELARKEAWLGTITSFLRQVMESAKHWDGTETQEIDALPKDEARQVIIKGL